MKVLRPINNNVISAMDDDGFEIIVVGRGIGFKAKEGDKVSTTAIEKISEWNHNPKPKN